jgi:hypothetical protein
MVQNICMILVLIVMLLVSWMFSEFSSFIFPLTLIFVFIILALNQLS